MLLKFVVKFYLAYQLATLLSLLPYYCGLSIITDAPKLKQRPARTPTLHVEGHRPEAVSKLYQMWPMEISALPKEPVDNWNYLHVGMLRNQHCIAANAKQYKKWFAN